MTLEAALLRHIIATVEKDCAHELQLLNAVNPVLPEQVPAWKLSEVHEILFENNLCEADHRGEDDLAPEEERAICKYAFEKYGSDFVFVTHFPSEHRAFYAMDDPEDPSLTLSFDLLMRGLEITSGGQRIHKEADYREKMLRRGMNPDAFHFYLDTFTSTAWHHNQGRPSGRSFLLPLRALRPSAIYARLSFLLIPFHSMKMGERKNTSFLSPVNLILTTSYFPVNWGDGSRCRRFTASLSSLHERTVRPSRPAYPRHTQPNIQLSVRPRKMPPRPRGLNADVAHAACKYSAVYLRWCSLCCL